MTRRVLQFLCVLVLSIPLQGSVSQAQRTGPPPQFRAGVELVSLDVSVVDREGRPVRGLTAADFTALEDGHPVEIRTFSAIDLPDTTTVASATWVRDVAPDVRRNDDLDDRRMLVLVMDDALPGKVGGGGPATQQLARKIANEFIDRLGPRDLAAVVFPLDKEYGQDFTTDRMLLHRAVNRYQVGMGAGPGKYRFVCESLASTLELLTTYLAEVPNHRKALVLLSEGIPMNLEDIGPRESISNGNDSAADMRNVFLAIRRMIAAAERANVAVYPIDPNGLWEGADPYKLDFLRALATNTGGFPVVDTNDYRGGLDRIYRDNSSYYLLGFISPNPRTQGRFRKLDVRVRDKTLTVRVRSGYFEPEATKPSAKAAPAPPPLMSALAALTPKGDVAMQMAAAPFAVPGSKKAAVAIVVGLREPAPSGGGIAIENVTLRVDAYNMLGDRKGTQQLSARIALRPTLAPTASCELLARLDLPPGRYQLRAAAQSSLQSKAGSIFYDMEVPDFRKGKLALSGIVLSADGGPVSAPKDGLAPLLPEPPTSARVFERNRTVKAFVRVYRPGGRGTDPTSVMVSVVDSSGTPVYSRNDTLDASRFTAEGATDCTVTLPLEQLKPGEHLLTVTVAAAGQRAERGLRFTVR